MRPGRIHQSNVCLILLAQLLAEADSQLQSSCAATNNGDAVQTRGGYLIQLVAPGCLLVKMITCGVTQSIFAVWQITQLKKTTSYYFVSILEGFICNRTFDISQDKCVSMPR